MLAGPPFSAMKTLNGGAGHSRLNAPRQSRMSRVLRKPTMMTATQPGSGAPARPDAFPSTPEQ